jgi:hypothetical protein
MAKLSPLQRVKQEHGSKAALAEKVLTLVSASEGEEAEAFEHRIKTMSNTKLLRLWSAHQSLAQRFGGKDELVKKIVAAKFPNGNGDYEAKVSTFSEPKLLDLARQLGVS